MTIRTQSDEQRVKEVYPDAYAAFLGAKTIECPAFLGGPRKGSAQGWIIRRGLAREQFMPLTADRKETEADAWHDAASRLPKAEAPSIPPLPSTQDCIHGCLRVDCPSCNPKSVAPPVAEPAPQTFEEWWDFSGCYWDIANEGDSYEKAIARAAWNAAKASSPVAHEWLGCEEANGWFVASCSCGWTYQHPNYGTTQETFVNHWGDHIKAVQPSSSPAVAGGEGENVLDAAIMRVLEQRCERGTPWDHAVLECAESLRRLKRGERADHETQPLIKDVRGKE